MGGGTNYEILGVVPRRNRENFKHELRHCKKNVLTIIHFNCKSRMGQV
jgi:thiamine monophosphate kinase